MRFIHTSDWHFGKYLHHVSLLDYQAQFADHFVDLVRSEKPDAVLISGDIYDRAIPPSPAVALLDETLNRLGELTTVILTPGNHDSATRLGFGSRLWKDSVRVVYRSDQIGQPITFAGDPPVHVYPLPYLEPDLARYELSEETGEDGQPIPLARSHEAVVSAAMRRVGADLARRGGLGVAMAHLFVTGGKVSDSEREITVGGVDNVSVAPFTRCVPTEDGGQRGIAYAALGHLHRPQTLSSGGAETVLRYSGSPLPMSFSESTDVKSTTLVEMTKDGPRLEVFEVESGLELKTVSGKLDDVLSPVPEWAERAYVSVEITDTVRPAHLFARVRSVFPRAILIRHNPDQTLATNGEGHVERSRRIGSRELATDFFTAALDRALDEKEKQILEDAWNAIEREDQ